MIVTYPGVGPSVCDRIFRVTPGVVAGVVPCADASVAMNPVTAQSAQDAIPAKSRRVSMSEPPCRVGITGVRTSAMQPASSEWRRLPSKLPDRNVLGKRESALRVWAGTFLPDGAIQCFQRPPQCAAVAASRTERAAVRAAQHRRVAPRLRWR